MHKQLQSGGLLIRTGIGKGALDPICCWVSPKRWSVLLSCHRFPAWHDQPNRTGWLGQYGGLPLIHHPNELLLANLSHVLSPAKSLQKYIPPKFHLMASSAGDVRAHGSLLAPGVEDGITGTRSHAAEELPLCWTYAFSLPQEAPQLAWNMRRSFIPPELHCLHQLFKEHQPTVWW